LLHLCLTSALDGGEWSASRPGRFTARITAPQYPLDRGWMGPSAGLDAVAKRKFPIIALPGNLTPVIQTVA